MALSVIDLPLCVHRHGCLPWSWNLFYALGSGESQRRNPESTIPECLFSTLVRLSINIEALRTRCLKPDRKGAKRPTSIMDMGRFRWRVHVWNTEPEAVKKASRRQCGFLSTEPPGTERFHFTFILCGLPRDSAPS